MVNPRVKVSKKEEWDAREDSIVINLAPMGVAVFQCTPEPEAPGSRGKKGASASGRKEPKITEHAGVNPEKTAVSQAAAVPAKKAAEAKAAVSRAAAVPAKKAAEAKAAVSRAAAVPAKKAAEAKDAVSRAAAIPVKKAAQAKDAAAGVAGQLVKGVTRKK